MLDRDLFDFLERTGDAAFAVTDGGEICSWNASAVALFGVEREQAIGRPCFELLQGRGVLGALVCGERCHVRDCAAQHAKVPDFDLEVKTGSSQRAWVNISTVVYEDAKTGRRRIVHLARDIAQRKRAEAILRRVLRLSRQLVDVSQDQVSPAPVAPLSDQERRVLSRFSEGKSPVEIERDLDITPQTLRNHLHHINRKLGTHTRLEAVIHAIRRHLI